MDIKLVIISLGILLSFSFSPFIQADVNQGRINYLDPVYEKMIATENCNCVAFRFDDIQNYWLLDVQLEVFETFREKNIPLTIGVIGKDFDGKIANYTKIIFTGQNIIEVANHSWAHGNFTTMDIEQQNQSIKKTNEKIFNVTGVYPKTFIPPFNEFTNETLTILSENNFTTLSSDILFSRPPYPLVTFGIHHFPETATTGVYDGELVIFKGLSHSETLKDIQQSQKKFGFSVVTLHPQEFSVVENGTYVNKINQNQINELVLLIDEIKKSGLKIVFLSQIKNDADVTLDNEIDSNLEPSNINNSSNEQSNGGGCLIATATYGSELAPQVQLLREIRDSQLLQTNSGSSFINSFNTLYYSFSPIVADYQRENPIFKELVKVTLTPMISSLLILNNINLDSEEKVLAYGISLILLNVGTYFGIPILSLIGIRKRFKNFSYT